MLKDNLHFPIEKIVPDLIAALDVSRCAIVSAPPAAGKTVHLPLVLLQCDRLADQKIIMLEPRRLAARRAAEFMAFRLREKVGQTVGYRVRGHSMTGRATRIEVVTEGILTRMLQADPDLPGVGLLIFDEFHERSIHADLGLALSLDVQQQWRPDLRIVIMSATLDGLALLQLLGEVPLLQINDTSFPVETRYARTSSDKPLETRIAETILRALSTEKGDLLVFLPGLREMRQVEEKLFSRIPAEVQVCLLHGDLPGATQNLALSPPSPGRRKVILSTSIAETSLTIDGVRIVIDSGLTRTARFDPARGMSGLMTLPVSQAAASQRRGRAGRQAAGVCYRMWTEREQEQLPLRSIPEIRVSDLAHLALDLAHWGAPNGEGLSFLDPPSPPHLAQAQNLLKSLGALNDKCQLTPHGKIMAQLPIHPRLSHMIIKSNELGWSDAACELAALLEEHELFARNRQAEVDLRSRIDFIKRGHGLTTESIERIRMQKAKWSDMFGLSATADKNFRTEPNPPQTFSDHKKSSEERLESLCGSLLAMAYPDRIARRRSDRPNAYHLANGMTALLHKNSLLTSEEYLAVADVDAGKDIVKIQLAAPLAAETLEFLFAESIQTEQEIGWDNDENRVRQRQRRKLGNLVLEEKMPEPGGDQVTAIFLQAIRRLGLDCLPWDKESVRLCDRVVWLRKNLAQAADFPDLSNAGLLASMEIWLAPRLAGMYKLAHLQPLRLIEILSSQLSVRQKRDLDRFAPAYLQVPSGSRIALEYPTDGCPFLAVKLQELFGWTETPRIGNQTVPVTIHLLSPAGRPLAVTQDLRSFWQNTYTEIRKQLRGRYPKHPWPENPLTATPTRRTVRRA